MSTDRIYIIQEKEMGQFRCVIALYDAIAQYEDERRFRPLAEMKDHEKTTMIKDFYFQGLPSRNPHQLMQWVIDSTRTYRETIESIGNLLQSGYDQVAVINRSSHPELPHQVLLAMLLKNHLGSIPHALWELMQSMSDYHLPRLQPFYEHYILPALCNTYGFYDEDVPMC